MGVGSAATGHSRFTTRQRSAAHRASQQQFQQSTRPTAAQREPSQGTPACPRGTVNSMGNTQTCVCADGDDHSGPWYATTGGSACASVHAQQQRPPREVMTDRARRRLTATAAAPRRRRSVSWAASPISREIGELPTADTSNGTGDAQMGRGGDRYARGGHRRGGELESVPWRPSHQSGLQQHEEPEPVWQPSGLARGAHRPPHRRDMGKAWGADELSDSLHGTKLRGERDRQQRSLEAARSVPRRDEHSLTLSPGLSPSTSDEHFSPRWSSDGESCGDVEDDDGPLISPRMQHHRGSGSPRNRLTRIAQAQSKRHRRRL